MLGFPLHPFQWRYAGVLVCMARCGNLWGQTPYYTTASIVNAADYSPGPFAPSSVLSLFGTNLAWTTQAVAPETLAGGRLPQNGEEDERPFAELHLKSPRGF